MADNDGPPWPTGRSRSDPDTTRLKDLAQQFRVDALRASISAGAAHPASAMSAAELVAVLVARHLRVDPASPNDPARDHLLLSRAYGAPLLYAALLAIGAISDSELLTYRQPGSRLQGQPGPGLPLVDTAPGSLGFGLAIGMGMALAMQRLEPRASRIWVVCGDGELAEGSVWEAVEAAGTERLDALTVIVDVNRLGTGPTRYGWDLQALRRRFEAFDWRVLEIDGHDVRAIDNAYRTASVTRFRPTAILARTIGGGGVHRVLDQPGLYGERQGYAEAAIQELGGARRIKITPPKPVGARPRDRRSPARRPPVRLPTWPVGSVVAAHDAVGEALVVLGTRRPDLVVLDADGGEETRLGRFRDVDPQRFFPVFVAEELLVGAAMGFAIRGWTPIAGSLGAFLLRAADIVRMAAFAGTPLRLVGSHAGASIGVEGPSQMGLEDVALFRAIDGAAVLQPSDANQAAQLLDAMLEWPALSYLRLLRGETTVRTPPRTKITIGGSREVASSPDDRVAIVAAGATIDEAIRAAELLELDRLRVRIIDAYSLKPLDAEAVAAAARAVDGRLVVVEDHRPEGGLGSAVAEAMASRGLPLRMAHLAVRGIPRSGSPHEQRAAAGIDAAAIAQAVTRLASQQRQT